MTGTLFVSLLFGIDLGATRIKTVTVSPTGETVRQDTFATDDSVEAPWAETIGRAIETVDGLAAGALSSIGLAAPGLAAPDGRSIAWMQGRMDALEGLDWTERLKREVPVRVLNDGHAALLGEVWMGAAKGCRNVVMLTLGTGVGGAALCDGRLLKGHLGRAGHFGHISLDPSGAHDIVNTPGSLEDAIGECTLEDRTEGAFVSTRRLLEAANGGDRRAQEVWRRSVRALACGMVSLTNALDPEVFVLGGGIGQAGPDLFDLLNEYLDEFEWRPSGHRVRILAAGLGDRAGAYGAAYYGCYGEKENAP